MTYAVCAYVFDEFLFALIMLHQDHLKTLPVGIYWFISDPEVLHWELLLPAGILAMLFPIIMFMLAQKWLLRGWAVGIIKG